MSIAQGVGSGKVRWCYLSNEDPDELVQARSNMVVKKAMPELLPEVLDIHGGS
jgi:hypothetical protein